jgi:hypothetical protein
MTDAGFTIFPMTTRVYVPFGQLLECKPSFDFHCTARALGCKSRRKTSSVMFLSSMTTTCCDTQSST